MIADKPSKLQDEIDSLRSQLKQAEAERKLLRQILDTLPDTIYIKDMDNRFLFANRAVTAMMGMDNPEDLIGKTDFDIYPEDLAQAYYDDEMPIIRGEVKRVHKEEPSLDMRTGAQGWLETTKLPYLDEDGEISGIIGIGRDITQRRIIEAALQESEERFRWLMDSIPHYIFGKDLDGRFIIANKAWCVAADLNFNEVVGKTDFDVHPSDLAAKYRADDQEVMNSRKTFSTIEEHQISATGERRYVQVTKAPLFDPNGEVAGILGVFWDVTEEHKVAQQSLKLQLEHERMQLMTNFITKATHEFNTSLSILETCLYFLENNIKPDKTTQYIHRMQVSTRHIHRLVEGLITLTRLDSMETIQKSKVNIMSIWHNVMASVQGIAEDKDIIIEVKTSPDLPIIHANPYDLTTAFKSLMDNAIRYTQNDGKITLDIQAIATGLQITLSDTGIGISQEEIERVFDRFYRGDKAHTTRGLGLGLPIAKRIIELHEGNIILESQVGKGSQLTIFLPY